MANPGFTKPLGSANSRDLAEEAGKGEKTTFTAAAAAVACDQNAVTSDPIGRERRRRGEVERDRGGGRGAGSLSLSLSLSLSFSLSAGRRKPGGRDAGYGQELGQGSGGARIGRSSEASGSEVETGACGGYVVL
ncbi:hypothetical protein M5K25_027794 [Dendrobium thyrsiflorum]|uniref:Uncharacterized protein n=1 Tax=Dendrobium thyrsiflorum TaxID=117978 RepID=A0ABD0TUQ1_DENTH